MAIAYKHIATGETVQKEQWRWVAIFDDGQQLNQFEVKDGQANFNPFAEIIKLQNMGAKLISLRLVHDIHPYVEAKIPEGAKPIHLYKKAILNHEQTLENGEKLTWQERVCWYVIGYEWQGQKTCIAITDANRVILTSDPDSINVTSKGAY